MAAGNERPLTLVLGHEELLIRQRYEALSLINDILIAAWFILGSVLFFSDATTTAGTWLFLIGSIQLLIRPVIRFTRQVHVRRLRGPTSPSHEASHDF